MPFDAYYPGCPTEDAPPYECDPCRRIERGKIRSTAFVHRSYYATLMLAPEDTATWLAGIEAGTIIIIPEVIGALDAPDPDVTDGFGDDAETNLDSLFVLTFRDPNYEGNCEFYNAIKKQRNTWHVAYRTETLTHVSNITVSLSARAPVTETITDPVTWNIRAAWRADDNPCPFATPEDIFLCYSLTETV